MPFNEMFVKRYLLTMAQNISQSCNGSPISQSDYNNLNTNLLLQEKGFTEDNLGDNGIGKTYRDMNDIAHEFQIMVQGGSMQQQMQYSQNLAQEKAKVNMKIAEEGMRDGNALLENYKCESGKVKTFSQNLANFINDIGAKRLTTETLAKKLAPYANPNHTSGGAKHAFCLAMKLNHPDMKVTRIQRVSLYQSLDTGNEDTFVSTFREIRNHNLHEIPNMEECFHIVN